MLLYWGVNFLKGSDVFSTSRVLYGVYNHTQGLDPGRPVTINGNNVGIVKSIEFTPDLSGDLVVTFELTTEYPIPANSVAFIVGDVLGNKKVELHLGDGDPVANGDTIATEVQPGLTEAVNEQLAPLKAKTEKLLGSLDTALAVFQGFLTPETQRDFRNSFANLNESFENLNSISKQVDADIVPRLSSITANLDKLTTTLAANRGTLDTIFGNVAAITDSLAHANIAQTINELAVASAQVNEILAKVNNGEGSLGKMLNDEDFYNNLNKATSSLDALLLDLRYNPNRYVEFSIFGSSPRYTPEEIEQAERERIERENSSTSGSSEN